MINKSKIELKKSKITFQILTYKNKIKQKI